MYQLSRYGDWFTGGTTKEPRFDSWQGQEIFLFSIARRPVLGHTRPPIRWISALLRDNKVAGTELDHSRSCRAEVKSAWTYTLTQSQAPAALPPVPIDRRLGGPRAGLDGVEKRKFLTLLGFALRPLSRPVRSQSLYRLRYPALKKLSLYLTN
jgi:hypothetical protein